MPQLRPTAITQNNENLNKAAKNVVTHVLRPRRCPALGDIVPCNQQTKSSLQKQSVIAAIPSHFYKEGSGKYTAVTCELARPKHRKAQTKKDEITAYSTNQIDIIDVDAKDKDNPLLVAEYVQDIFKYLRKIEGIYQVHEKYLVGHQITARMRSILINWLIEVCINFKFLQETLHLTISVLDRYLQLNRNIDRNTLQLVGISALLIAAKYEEMCVPSISDFVFICDDAFTENEIIKTELDILGKLKFNLGRPLSLHFLRRYSKIASSKMDHHNLAKYFLEIFLLDYDICNIDPSLQAATACCLSICVLNDIADPKIVWSENLEHYSLYKYSDLKPLFTKLVKALRKMEKSKFQAIKKKYAAQKFGNISNHTKLQTSRLLKALYEKATLSVEH